MERRAYNEGGAFIIIQNPAMTERPHGGTRYADEQRKPDENNYRK